VSAPRALIRALRYAWALPVSAPGAVLVLSALASGGRAAVVDGVLEAHGGLVALILRYLVPLPGGASAMTLGHVVIGRDAACLERTRAHERAHVRQCEAWGPLFIPAYVMASIVVAVTGRHYYRDNRFEREAVAAAKPPCPGKTGISL
jgi:hypothetical protein